MLRAEGRNTRPIAIGLTLVLLGAGVVAYEAATHSGESRSSSVGLAAANSGPIDDDEDQADDEGDEDADDPGDDQDDADPGDDQDDADDSGDEDDADDPGDGEDDADDPGDDEGDADDPDDGEDDSDEPVDEAPSTPAPPAPAPAPSGIDAPAGSRVVGTADVVTGTQTYTCAAGTFVGTNSVPEAQLSGSIGDIHHFGGPSWQSVADQSLVTATKKDFVNVAGSIPELLLTVNSHSGTGILSDVAFIQRLKTSGGAAPTAACADGEKAAVPYRATYVFLAAS
jgi:hypothetical protein